MSLVNSHALTYPLLSDNLSSLPSHPSRSLSTSHLLNLPVRVLSLQELQPSHVIVGAFNYYSLFVWKKLKIETFPQLMEQVTTNSNWTNLYFTTNYGGINNNSTSTNSSLSSFNNYYFPHVNTPRPFQIICPKNYPCQNLWQLMTFSNTDSTNNFKVVDNMNSKFSFDYRCNLFSDCRYGSLLEYGDAFLMTPFDFSMIVRVNLQVTQKGLFSQRMRPLQVPFELYNPLQMTNSTISSTYNPSDFVAIPVIPSRFIVLDEMNSEMTSDSSRTKPCESTYSTENPFITSSCTYLQLALKHTSVRFMTSCSESALHDVWDGLHGLLNFSQHDIELVQKLLNFQLQVNYSLMNALPHELSRIDSNRVRALWTLSNVAVSNYLWNSTCHYCSSRLCVSENIERTDYFIIVYAIFMGVYYLLFFGFRMYRLPSMKRRLLLPFVTPFALLLFETSWSSVARNACASVMLPFSILIVGFIFTLYFVIVLRNLYLRVLYKFLRQQNSKNISQKEKPYKFYKILASERMGWFLCTAIPSIFMIVFSIPSSVVSSVLFSELILSNRTIFASIALCGCVLALIYLVIDFLTCKKVFRKGIRWFFFFDDPLFIRIDLLSLQLLMILLIIYLILLPLNTPFYPVDLAFATTAFLRMFICIFLMMSSGGLTMTIELFNLILAKKTDTFIIDSVQSLEHLLFKYSCFEELFKDYCTRELNLEHLLFFEELSEIKNSSKISQTTFERLEKVFIDKYSIFEVSLPKKTISQFYKMKEKMKQRSKSTHSHLEEVSPPNILHSSQLFPFSSTTTSLSGHDKIQNATTSTFSPMNSTAQPLHSNHHLETQVASPSSPIPSSPNKEENIHRPQPSILSQQHLQSKQTQQLSQEWVLFHQLNTHHKSSSKLEQRMTILLEQLNIDVVFNLREIFSRFKTTKEFRDWVKKMKKSLSLNVKSLVCPFCAIWN
ncbi:hypothetical protein FDP41_001505 [Naegleria fowleri]|uniref:RGS domain-containing protein n=1 Tax=Naegleria fowleri TaxID=5763 RepID=A0A6A5BWY8_NAEFO|nr:uncharacterized protein FDP41_001505 [Naegleria fowleri]KAF0979162.1 hypothetical protein FDP41_001505 [Naegleria fowleri]